MKIKKMNRKMFIIWEAVLAIFAIFLTILLFTDEKPQKKVAVIVENSGSGKWDSFIHGLKDSAKQNDIHLVICNTDEIEDYIEERNLIKEQLSNEVDGFIIQPAPGTNVEAMFEENLKDKYVITINEDFYVEETDSAEDSAADSRLGNHISINADNYELGKGLAQKIIADEGGALEGKTMGIVAGMDKTSSAKERIEGFCNEIEKTGINIKWIHNKKYSQNSLDIVNTQASVDYLVALDTDILEEITTENLSSRFAKCPIYGVGGSMASISLVDKGTVNAIVVPQLYDVGYKAVDAISEKFDKKWKSPANYVCDYLFIDKSNIYTEEIENYIYTLKR